MAEGVLTRLELDELFHPVPGLETERLLLEPLRVVHAEGLFQILSDPAVAGPSCEMPHASVDVTRAHVGDVLKRRDTRTGMTWALVSKEDGAMIGQVSIHSISWANRRGDLGFNLASRAWRRGLMSEALRAVIEFCFSRLRFIKVCAQNLVDNDGCHALLLRLGFEQEGLLRRHGFWGDRAHDLRQYGLVAAARASICPAEEVTNDCRVESGRVLQRPCHLERGAR
jgi:ribosomal-protein-alanine N-acetyltransferase